MWSRLTLSRRVRADLAVRGPACVPLVRLSESAGSQIWCETDESGRLTSSSDDVGRYTSVFKPTGSRAFVTGDHRVVDLTTPGSKRRARVLQRAPVRSGKFCTPSLACVRENSRAASRPCAQGAVSSGNAGLREAAAGKGAARAFLGSCTPHQVRGLTRPNPWLKTPFFDENFASIVPRTVPVASHEPALMSPAP